MALKMRWLRTEDNVNRAGKADVNATAKSSLGRECRGAEGLGRTISSALPRAHVGGGVASRLAVLAHLRHTQDRLPKCKVWHSQASWWEGR